MPGSARDEAERLVATVLAMASTAGSGADREAGRDRVGAGLSALAGLVGQAVDALGEQVAGGGQAAPDGHVSGGHATTAGGGWATGSAECCVCPVCRVIATMRDPSPEAAARLATGAGDLASGVASVMRALSAMAGERPARPAPASRPAGPPNPDETWQNATRRPDPAAEPNRPGDAWSAATNATAPPSDAGAGAGPAQSAGPGDSAQAGGAGPAQAGGAGPAQAGGDPWAAASAAGAAAAQAERAELGRRRAAAQAAAAEAARRVAEAAAQARAARAAATAEAATADTGAGGGAGRDGVPASGRTPQGFDVWAAATADAGVGGVASAPAVDHDVPGAAASEERGGVAGDDARDGDAV